MQLTPANENVQWHLRLVPTDLDNLKFLRAYNLFPFEQWLGFNLSAVNCITLKKNTFAVDVFNRVDVFLCQSDPAV